MYFHLGKVVLFCIRSLSAADSALAVSRLGRRHQTGVTLNKVSCLNRTKPCRLHCQVYRADRKVLVIRALWPLVASGAGYGIVFRLFACTLTGFPSLISPFFYTSHERS